MENRKEVCMISDQECHEASFDDNSWHDPVNIKNRTSPVSIDELFAPVKEEYFNSDILFLKQVTRTAPSTLPDSVLEQLFVKLEPTVLPDSVSDDTCSNRSVNYDGDGDTLEGDEAIVLPDSLLDDICFVDFDDLVYIKNRICPVSIDELFAPVKEEYFNSDILFLKQVTRTAPSTLPDSVLEQLFGNIEPTVLPDSVSDDMCSNSGNYDGDTLEGDEAIVLPDSLLDDICFDFDDLAKEK